MVFNKNSHSDCYKIKYFNLFIFIFLLITHSKINRKFLKIILKMLYFINFNFKIFSFFNYFNITALYNIYFF
jgi:hypothetical protein